MKVMNCKNRCNMYRNKSDRKKSWPWVHFNNRDINFGGGMKMPCCSTIRKFKFVWAVAQMSAQQFIFALLKSKFFELLSAIVINGPIFFYFLFLIVILFHYMSWVCFFFQSYIKYKSLYVYIFSVVWKWHDIHNRNSSENLWITCSLIRWLKAFFAWEGLTDPPNNFFSYHTFFTWNHVEWCVRV